jgi:hypothetical protein
MKTETASPWVGCCRRPSCAPPGRAPASDEARCMTGTTVVPDGGFTAR